MMLLKHLKRIVMVVILLVATGSHYTEAVMMKENNWVLYPSLILGVHVPLVFIFIAIVYGVLKPLYKRKMKPVQTANGPKTPELERGVFLVPSYWTNIDKADLEYIDITQDADPIKHLVYSLWQPKEVGIGKDVGKRKCKLQYIHIRKVERIQNFALYQKYYRSKRMLQRKIKHIDCFEDLRKHSKKPILTTAKISSSQGMSSLLDGIDRHLNEHYLFHGTKNTAARFIWRQGLSMHFATKGLYGKGVYMAEDPTKTDQYTDGTRTNNILLLCRVCLGEIYVQRNETKSDELESPPCRTCFRHKCPDHNNLTFDSVVTDVRRRRFREYIVYRDYRVYPEYIITYDREKDDRNMRVVSRF